MTSSDQFDAAGQRPVEDWARGLVERFVAARHRMAETEPVEGPDSGGWFPNGWGVEPAPLVVDANGLWGDLLRMAVTCRRTVLFTAANMGVLRLYCAQHVVDELVEHHGEWAAVRGVEPGAVLDVILGTVLPLLRVVQLPTGLTTSSEEARLVRLAAVDADDVPTATLAMVLGAPVLSKDRHLLDAVYGPGFDRRSHGEWLERVRSGSTAGTLGQNIRAAETAVAAAGQLAFAAGRGVGQRVSGAVLVGAAAAVTVAVGSAAAERRGKLADVARTVGDFLVRSLVVYADMTAMRRAALEGYGQLATPLTDWPDAPVGAGSPGATVRDVAAVLSRHPRSAVWMVDLAATVPGRSFAAVRRAAATQGFRVGGVGDEAVVQLGRRAVPLARGATATRPGEDPALVADGGDR